MTWNLIGSPYKVQSLALQRAEGKKGFLYLLEPGLGKSAIVLNEFLTLKKSNKINKLLVICPNSLKNTWYYEAEKWGTGLNLSVWNGKLSAQDIIDGLIINYEALIRNGEPSEGGKLVLELIRYHKTYVCFDECHRLKNHAAKSTKFVLRHMLTHAEVRRGLTGTLIGNSPMDAYSQLRLAGACQGINPFSFRNAYCRMGGYMNKQIMGIAEGREKQLYNLIDSVSFRATKKEYLDIPDKVYKTIILEMEPKLKKYYNEMKKDYQLNLQDNQITVNMMIAQMQKLQQISSGFIIKDKESVVELIPFQNTHKFKALLDIIEDIDNKVIIFTIYRHTAAQLELNLKIKLQDKVVSLMGGMFPSEIKEVINSFNNDKDVKAIILPIQIGKEGLTLLGSDEQTCHTTIYYENSYSLIDRKQSEDRNHRIGQKNSVVIHDLISSKIEERIVTALQKKNDLAEVILSCKNI